MRSSLFDLLPSDVQYTLYVNYPVIVGVGTLVFEIFNPHRLVADEGFPDRLFTMVTYHFTLLNSQPKRSTRRRLNPFSITDRSIRCAR